MRKPYVAVPIAVSGIIAGLHINGAYTDLAHHLIFAFQMRQNSASLLVRSYSGYKRIYTVHGLIHIFARIRAQLFFCFAVFIVNYI